MLVAVEEVAGYGCYSGSGAGGRRPPSSSQVITYAATIVITDHLYQDHYKDLSSKPFFLKFISYIRVNLVIFWWWRQRLNGSVGEAGENLKDHERKELDQERRCHKFYVEDGWYRLEGM
nr:hypothetical protein [Tanacetum cinerariifolium]